MPRDQKLARAAVFGGSFFNLLFAALFAMGIIANWDNLIYAGLPNAQLILSLPLIGLAFGIAALALLFPVWRGGGWSLLGRIRYSSVVIALLLFAGVANYWNLLGPWRA